MILNSENKNFVLKGAVCYSTSSEELKTLEQGYLVCEDGLSSGVFQELPEKYQGLPIRDYGTKLILPGLTDLHLHAPQYAFRGMEMDLELLDWLNEVTFPEEAKYQNLEYAKKAYAIFADAMKHSATTRACIFGTIHLPATLLLMELMEETGIKSLIGKVNMDRNSPGFLKEESAAESAKATLSWLEQADGRFQNVSPILTPRFIPSCTDDLMRKLKEIQTAYDLPVQSHLSENQGEIKWVQELCPDSKFYGDAYDQFGLFGGKTRTIMAHCVSSGEKEQMLMKERGVFIAHCPESNENLSSGIAPARSYLNLQIPMGLGTDVAGGCSESIFRAMADAIKVSKLRWRLADQSLMPLTVSEAFYLGTKGGGAFFGKVGSFEQGYEFDAVVINDEAIRHPQELTVRQRLERVIYLSDDRHVSAKYVSGSLCFDVS